MTVRYASVESPIGTLLLTTDGQCLTGLIMCDDEIEREIRPGWTADETAAPLVEAKRQLREYFAGARTRFDVPLNLHGTDFQIRVWQALLQIPFGETISYSELAKRIGSPAACRAVGLANGRNPVAVIVPCHRVIGANGRLVGYGGGLDRKRKLLDLERTACGGCLAPARPPLTPGRARDIMTRAELYAVRVTQETRA